MEQSQKDALKTLSEDDLQFSSEYAEYIMTYGSGDRIICNGDTLLKAQEDGYLFDEFKEYIGYESA